MVQVLINPGQSVRDNGKSIGEGFQEISNLADAILWQKQGTLKILPGQGIKEEATPEAIYQATSPISDEIDREAIAVQFKRMSEKIDELEKTNSDLRAEVGTLEEEIIRLKSIDPGEEDAGDPEAESEEGEDVLEDPDTLEPNEDESPEAFAIRLGRVKKAWNKAKKVVK